MKNFFAICPRGLEELLVAELASVGASELRSTHGGVFFAGDWLTCYRANACDTAGKVLTLSVGAGSNVFFIGTAVGAASADGDDIYVDLDLGFKQG